jgi:hypothetical protein
MPAELVKTLSYAFTSHLIELNLPAAENKRTSQCVVMVAREHETGLGNRLCMQLHGGVSPEASDSKYSFDIKVMWQIFQR